MEDRILEILLELQKDMKEVKSDIQEIKGTVNRNKGTLNKIEAFKLGTMKITLNESSLENLEIIRQDNPVYREMHVAEAYNEIIEKVIQGQVDDISYRKACETKVHEKKENKDGKKLSEAIGRIECKEKIDVKRMREK